MDTNLCECFNDKDNKIDRIVDNAVDYAISRGIVMIKKQENYEKVMQHLPFTLFPTPIPAQILSFLKEIQPHMNKLLFLVGRDADFIKASLQNVMKSDEFTKKLYEIYEKIQPSNKNSMELGIFRSDYMLNCKEVDGKVEYLPKQIETNTLAVSFIGCGTQKAKELYSRILKECELSCYINKLQDNKAAIQVAKGFVMAWENYSNPNAVVIFVIQTEENNIFDQREIEYQINLINPDIKIRRKYFDDLVTDMELKEDNTLFIDGEEVAIVYFRTAYMPESYTTEEHWQVRLDIEKSKAVKAPSVGTQLAGSKKIQQVLAEPGVVERFIKDPEIAKQLRSTFAGLYTLERNKSGDEAVKLALRNPSGYVLKPQREGGGNNLYEDDMVKVLKGTENSDERMQYILMERIFPKTSKNIIIANGKSSGAEVVSELGIYGVYFSKGDNIVENYTAGHLLRSKSKEFNDGGVAAGVAVIDTPLLV